VDWLEAGTPLITFAGTSCIGALSRAFPQMPILADYKAMDGVRKYVLETAKQGGHIATVCAVASDASIRTAVQAGQDAQIAIISDLYAAPDVPQRAAQVEAMGVDSLYVHWGADQRAADPDHDPQADLRPVIERVRVPVGVATFSVEDGIRAFRQGAAIAVIGVPLIQETDVEGALRDYVERAKAAYRPV
jgi:3-hexulose-6-phosphate synthase